MTAIYQLASDPGYKSLVPPEDNHFMELVQRFNGTRIGESWGDFKMEYDPDRGDLPAGDFPSIYLSHIPVFSRKAAEELYGLLKSAGELLPFKADQDEYLAFNVTVLVSALSLHDSEIVYFASGKIMAVKKYVLAEKHLASQPIFKLAETPLMSVFVNEDFVRTVDLLQLRGFSFSPITLV